MLLNINFYKIYLAYYWFRNYDKVLCYKKLKIYKIHVIIILCNYKILIQKGWQKMIKYLMRKTIYKEVDHETQDMLLQLIARYHIIEFLCFMFWAVIYIFPFIPLFIIDVFEDVEISMTTQIAILAFALINAVGLLVSLKVFKRAMFGFSKLLAERIYFLACTKKGKALSKKDFETIRQVNENLYALIATQNCRGYCYSICFEMCKALKKGSIEFIAVKKFAVDKDDEDDGKAFTMHVLYINDGWAFDTYSSRQYPIEKLHKIYKAKVYKVFDYASIRDKSYEEFRDEQEPELAKWSTINDCSMFWKEKNEET